MDHGCMDDGWMHGWMCGWIMEGETEETDLHVFTVL